MTPRALALLCSTLALAAAAAPARADAPAKLVAAYKLATSAGDIHTTAAPLAWDPRSNEVLVIDGTSVRVFNSVGMEVHVFEQEEDLGRPMAVAALDEESGDYLLSVVKDGKNEVWRCDFRGRAYERFELRGLDRPFVAGAMRYVDGRLFLGGAPLIVIADLQGKVLKTIDLSPALASPLDDPDEKAFLEPEIRGLAFDARGNALFAIPTAFRVFIVSPEGATRSFGKRGGTAGKFNVVVGASADDEGNIYVLDARRSSVSLFTPDFVFVTQFAGSGNRLGGLIAPTAILAANGLVYVSQSNERGVTVYRPAVASP